MLRRLAESQGSVRVSRLVESEPWGFGSPNSFLNVGISFDCELEPEELLDATQAIQRQICPDSHRDAAGNYIDRLIDIDIICGVAESQADGSCSGGKGLSLCVVDTDRLQLPHPCAFRRDFVMRPLAEIDPEMAHLLSIWFHQRQQVSE